MKIKIPESVKIYGNIYEVKHSTDVSTAGNTNGAIHFSSLKIFIDPESSPQVQHDAFLHEILHDILRKSGLSTRLCKLDEDLEEDIIIAMTTGWYQVITDNDFIEKE